VPKPRIRFVPAKVCLILASLSAACAAPVPAVARAETPPSAPIDVQFKLTDLDYKPIAGVPVRVAFGPDAAWQSPDAGTRFTTDAAGQFRFTASAEIDEQPKKMPTNFADSLTSRPQPTDHLRVAVELPYMTFRWAYVVDLWRFRNGGDVMNEGVSVYTPDDRGRFTREAKRVDGGWLMADLKGLALTTPGHEPWDYFLEPRADPKSPGWSLRLAFKRSPPPVRR